ncbi:uncharacterized protein JCM6883_003274 [Sporobolomyces salmoneus]|uniref:uncharacterized protein n=1 Tax=Sporobolomyces salmoneus TaxID=183962 RepID=UPI003182AED0
MSEEAINEHAYLCFEAINAQLNNSTLLEPDFDDSLEFPLFVTWNIKSRSDGEYRLRGCIGNFEAMPLRDGLKDYAAISAFRDHRFDPVTLKELKRLQCGVSLLTDFQECKDHLDWTLDVHGIYVQFPNPALTFPPSSSPSSSSSTPSTASTPSTGSTDALSTTSTSYRSLSSLPQLELSLPRSANPNRLKTVLHATFLPDVAGEQGWSKVDAVNAAIRKAGYKGTVTEELRKKCKVSRYQSKKVKVDHEEWLEWRNRQLGN